MPTPSSRQRSRSSSKNTPSHGTSRSTQSNNPPPPASTRTTTTPRRYNSLDLTSYQQSQQRPQYNRQQSRNSSPSHRSSQVAYKTRRAHFSDSVSDTASAASSSTSPSGSKTAISDEGRYPSMQFRMSSAGIQSTKSDSSGGVVRKRDKINNVKKVIDGMFLIPLTCETIHRIGDTHQTTSLSFYSTQQVNVRREAYHRHYECMCRV